MTIKELKETIKHLEIDRVINDETMIGVSVKKAMGESADPIIYVSDEGKVKVNPNDGILWIDGEFE